MIGADSRVVIRVDAEPVRSLSLPGHIERLVDE